MSVEPELPNYDNSRWYKLMEEKGEKWNHFASKFGFEVNGQYQHYHCRVNGNIDLSGIVFQFEGYRQYIDRIPQILIDTFSEVLMIKCNLRGRVSNSDFFFGKSSLLKRIKFWCQRVKIIDYQGFILASKSDSFALEIMNALNWAVYQILFVELSQNCLTIKFNPLLDEDKEFELLYRSLVQISAAVRNEKV